MDLVFVDSASTKTLYIEKYGFKSSQVIISGYQTYKEVRDNINNKIKKQKSETILWLPRWVLNFRNRDLFEGGSTFLNYHYFFYNYAQQNPNINFIIRPHPTLFFASSNQNFLVQEQLDQIFEKFRSLPNVIVSDSTNTALVADIINADIIISDGSSALAEVVVADKPIIYLSNGWNNEFNSNKLSRELKKYIYFAYDHIDIINHIAALRQADYKPFYKVQENIDYFEQLKCKLNITTCNRDEFKKILDPVENPAKFIANYLLNN